MLLLKTSKSLAVQRRDKIETYIVSLEMCCFVFYIFVSLMNISVWSNKFRYGVVSDKKVFGYLIGIGFNNTYLEIIYFVDTDTKLRA